MIQLFAQLALINQIGQTDGFGAIQQAERHLHIGPVVKHRLAHQQLVEIRVDQGPDDRVDLPFVVMHTGRDVDHGSSGAVGASSGRLDQRRATTRKGKPRSGL